jgi:hypothetical protein
VAPDTLSEADFPGQISGEGSDDVAGRPVVYEVGGSQVDGSGLLSLCFRNRF